MVPVGQNTGFAQGNEEKIDSFTITLHRIFIKLLGTRHHPKRLEMHKPAKPAKSLCSEGRHSGGERQIRVVTEHVAWCVRTCEGTCSKVGVPTQEHWGERGGCTMASGGLTEKGTFEEGLGGERVAEQTPEWGVPWRIGQPGQACGRSTGKCDCGGMSWRGGGLEVP